MGCCFSSTVKNEGCKLKSPALPNKLPCRPPVPVAVLGEERIKQVLEETTIPSRELVAGQSSPARVESKPQELQEISIINNLEKARDEKREEEDDEESCSRTETVSTSTTGIVAAETRQEEPLSKKNRTGKPPVSGHGKRPSVRERERIVSSPANRGRVLEKRHASSRPGTPPRRVRRNSWNGSGGRSSPPARRIDAVANTLDGSGWKPISSERPIVKNAAAEEGDLDRNQDSIVDPQVSLECFIFV